MAARLGRVMLSRVPLPGRPYASSSDKRFMKAADDFDGKSTG